MSNEHKLLLGLFLIAVGGQVAMLKHWQEGLAPAQIGAIVVQVGVLVRAFYSEKPGPK